ncbi:hypothetical protein CK203_086764 [Vitis vinifera]|uniref:GAG-pre-integrase domain-containing protein n=1 Tax=Vitis vinifera TaxID=29760 RepID=A0A438D7J1_VITVI|nr:hypothetical protein CK203_086764 [Vitis vinifera]
MKLAIGKTYMFLPTAKDVWDAIWETYSDAENASQIFEIKMRLWQMKQGDREVTEYYTEMLGLWQDLDLNYEEEWECTGDSVRFKKKMENERVFEFLTGLNRELDDVRSRVLSRRSLPSIREVFFEVRPHVAAGCGPHAAGSSGPSLRQSKRTYCEHCTFFTTLSTMSQITSWIIDSGAYDHMTDAHHLFSTYSPCAGNLKVKIANGTLSPFASKGSIRISESSTLNPVLHDLSLGKTIGSAKEHEGLYYFDETDLLGQCPPIVCNSASYPKDSELLLWHKMMGHPSFQYLKTFILFTMFK